MENAETLAYAFIIQAFRNLSLNCQFNAVFCFAKEVLVILILTEKAEKNDSCREILFGKQLHQNSFLPLAAISIK